MIKLLTFKGGIHPPQEKNTRDKSICTIHPQKGRELIFPVIQHNGTPCTPAVSAGDAVLVGQLIAKASSNKSATIHSSVSGIVKEIRPVLTPSGITCDAVVIENDGELNEIEMNGHEDFSALAKQEILKIIQNSGIVGLGGAGFPTHIKLNPPEDKKIDYIIINAAECEPYLSTDHRVLLEEYEKLITGLRIILHIHSGAKGIIAIETNKADAIALLEKACADFPNISVAKLKPKYPQGSEKQLIYAITKKEIPSGGLPSDTGCIVNNVDTVIAIHRAVMRGRPLMRKIVTVDGNAVKNPGNYKVRLGMTYADLFEEIGGFTVEPTKIVAGGPMMGMSVFDPRVPIIKTSSAILCFSGKKAELPAESNCIKCGRCVNTCPMGLLPLELNQNVKHNELDRFRNNNGLDCIECGCCSYICPAKRHLTQSINYMRRNLMVKR